MGARGDDRQADDRDHPRRPRSPSTRRRSTQLVRGEAVEHFETRRRRRDGSLVDVSLALSAVRNPDGSLLAISAIARDITERKRFEDELQRLADHDPLTGLLNRRRFVEELGAGGRDGERRTAAARC